MKLMKKLMALALVAVALLAVTVPAMAYSTMYVNVGAGQTVRLRNAANSSAKVLINVPHGSAVQAQSENSTWHKVQYAGYIGYMMSNFLSYSNPNGGGGSTGGTATAGLISADTGPVNIRSSPSTNSSILASLPIGTPITYYDGAEVTNAGYTWYRCTGTQWSGTGYVVTKYVVRDSGSGSTYPGVQGSGPNSKVTAQDIRNGTAQWVVDNNTKHPQIKKMQELLNKVIKEQRGSDGGYTNPDGYYGPNTAELVKVFSEMPVSRTNSSKIMDRNTLAALERLARETIQ